VLVSLTATCKWFNAGLPKGHDAIADMLSAQAAWNSILVHHMLPGWSNDWFMGYPQFYVHPPLSSILAMASSVPFGWVLGTKLLFLAVFILSGVFAYFYAHELTKNRFASIAAGLAYLFLPYHIIDVGFEGHHGSFSVPYMLLPLMLLCLERMIKKPGIKYFLINGVLLALLTLTFPQVFPLLVGPFLVLYVILRIWWERHRGKAYLRNVFITSAGALCLSLLLTAFWWLPLISEIRYSFATSFSLEDAEAYSATFLQAVTLRPSLCCAPSSAYASAGSVFLEILRMLPFILVVIGVVLNRKNRYVWFFSLSTLIAVLLAMGPGSPISIFGFGYRYVPLFTSLRTPVRFLLFASLAYSVLIAFCVQAVAERLGKLRLTDFRAVGAPLLLSVLVSLIIVGNTWQETRTAFSTFSLTGDQKNALAYLADQEGGDYRIADPPFDAYVYDNEAGYIIRPTFWTYLHGKETVYGPGSSMAVKYTATALESLNAALRRGPFDMSRWFSILNVKYVLIDKTDPLSANIVLGTDFEPVWTSDTIDIYENHAMKPRLFSYSPTNERYIPLWSADRIYPQLADGYEVGLALDARHVPSHDVTLQATFQFTRPKGEWLNLGVDVSAVQFERDDSIHLVFYSDRDLPDIYLSLDVFEQDGSRYGMDFNRDDVIKAGWNEIAVPISLLPLRHSTDENGHLDTDQIEALWFGPGERARPDKPHVFDLYFAAPSVVSQQMNGPVEYTKTRPGKYKVHVSLESPSCLVLSEAYHPNWVARVNGETVHSQLVYQALNGFNLEAGEYDITLEFVSSPWRIAGNAITGVMVSILCSLGLYVMARRWREKRRCTRQMPEPGESEHPQT
jgi:hypothetical protein